MGERVPELVRVEVIESGLGGTPAEHLSDAAGSHGPRPTQPQHLESAYPMSTAYAEVAIDCLDVFAPIGRTRTREPLPVTVSVWSSRSTSSSFTPAISEAEPLCR
jgi:hypothetical protein